MIIDKKRKSSFSVWKRRGEPTANLDAYYLILLERDLGRFYGYWHIPLEYNGDLAMTPPRRSECYEVSWRKVPEALKSGIRACVKRIEEAGTPMDRDEHIYG